MAVANVQTVLKPSIGDLGAGAGGEAVYDAAVAAATRRAAAVRAMWARLDSKGVVEEEAAAAEEDDDESRPALKRTRE